MTTKSGAGGTLSIVSGAFGILSAAFVILFIDMFGAMFSLPGFHSLEIQGFLRVMVLFYVITAIAHVLLGALAIIGGIFTIRRQSWPLALAGAIAATITFYPTGIAAVIITIISREEFPAMGTD